MVFGRRMKLIFVCLFISNALAKDAQAGNGCTKNDQTFKEGEHYKFNKLRYECKQGVMMPIGCYDDSDKDIEPGQDFHDKDNFKFNCYKKGLIIGYSYVPDKEAEKSKTLSNTLLKPIESKKNELCSKEGKTFKEGELYRNNNLRYQCLSGVLHVLGCYDAEGKDISPGEEFLDKNKLRYHCYKKGSTVGYTYLEAISGNNITETRPSTGGKIHQPLTCLHHTGEYKDGQEYRHDYLRWKCIEGVMRILGCYDYNNKDIEVDQNFLDDQKNTFHCYRKDKRVGYYWLPKDKEVPKH